MKEHDHCLLYRRATAGRPVVKVLSKGLTSIVFGGPNTNILFAVVGSTILNEYTGQILERASAGTSLYVITGLGAKGRKYSRLII